MTQPSAASLPQQRDRQAFEQWFVPDALPLEHSNWFALDDDHNYILDSVQRDWNVWQAAWCSAAEALERQEEVVIAALDALHAARADNARLLAEAAEAKKNVQHDVQFQAENAASCVRQLEGERDAAETRASALAQRVERLETALTACVKHLADWAEPGKCVLTVAADLEVLKYARAALESGEPK